MRLAIVLAVVLGCRVLPAELAGGTRAPLRMDNGHVTVRVEADGHPLTLVVDTGASITAISTAAAARLGLATTGTTPVNGRIVRTGVVRRLSIANSDHADVRIAMVEMREIDQRREHVDGVLGLDVLGRHDIIIDPQRHVLGFHPTGTLARWTTHDMSRVPFERAKHGLVILRITLQNDTTVPAVLDLGSPISYLNRQAAASSGYTARAVDGHDIVLGDVDVKLRALIVQDLPVFERLGISGPAMLLGTDAFYQRTLAIGYADQFVLVSR